MSKIQLYKEIGLIDDDLVKEAETADKNGITEKTSFIRWGVFAACFAVMLAVSIPMLLNSGDDAILTPITLSAVNDFDMMRSDKGITVRYIDNLPEDRVKSSTNGLLAYFTEEELLAFNTEIFSGTVLSVRNIEISTDNYKDYRAIVKIQVDKTIRGTVSAGDTISVFINFPFDKNMWVEDNDILEKIRAGQKGIFMPAKIDDECAYIYGDKKLDKRDLAEYCFLDGIRYLFLETENGLEFDRNSYESVKSATSLIEIEDYIISMIK